jgi:hypothetical protein
LLGGGPSARGSEWSAEARTWVVSSWCLRRIEAQRPWLVAQVLLTGATPQQVVSVLGWELDELRFAIGRWASTLCKGASSPGGRLRRC